MSQKRLAATIGVETCSIAAYEMGRKHVGAHRLCLISRALSCPVSYFFARQGEAFSRRQERGRERGSAGKHVQPQARALARAYYLINAYRLCHTG